MRHTPERLPRPEGAVVVEGVVRSRPQVIRLPAACARPETLDAAPGAPPGAQTPKGVAIGNGQILPHEEGTLSLRRVRTRHHPGSSTSPTLFRGRGVGQGAGEWPTPKRPGRGGPPKKSRHVTSNTCTQEGLERARVGRCTSVSQFGLRPITPTQRGDWGSRVTTRS